MMRRIGPYDLSDKRLGEGAFAKVYRGVHTVSGQEVAIKISTSNYSRRGEELKALYSIKHPFVVELFDQYAMNDKLLLILECCPGGDLAKLLSNARQSLPTATVKRLGYQLICAMHHLEGMKIMHRDIKPANILLTVADAEIADIRVGDLGFAKRNVEAEDLLKSQLGTKLFMAPERLQQQRYSFKSEVWATGIILFEMAFGAHPFNSKSEQELMKDISMELRFPEGADERTPDLCDLLRRMIQRDPNARMSMEEAKQHSFFDSVRDAIDADIVRQSAIPKKKTTAPTDRSDGEQKSPLQNVTQPTQPSEQHEITEEEAAAARPAPACDLSRNSFETSASESKPPLPPPPPPTTTATTTTTPSNNNNNNNNSLFSVPPAYSSLRAPSPQPVAVVSPPVPDGLSLAKAVFEFALTQVEGNARSSLLVFAARLVLQDNEDGTAEARRHFLAQARSQLIFLQGRLPPSSKAVDPGTLLLEGSKRYLLFHLAKLDDIESRRIAIVLFQAALRSPSVKNSQTTAIHLRILQCLQVAEGNLC